LAGILDFCAFQHALKSVFGALNRKSIPIIVLKEDLELCVVECLNFDSLNYANLTKLTLKFPTPLDYKRIGDTKIPQP